MYNDKLVYKIIIWVFFRISLWKEKEALIIDVLFLWTYNVTPNLIGMVD